MDRIRFQIDRAIDIDTGEPQYRNVNIFVNGQDLRKILGTDKQGLPLNEVTFPSRRFLGNANESNHAAHIVNGKVAVLECTCGEEGCGSIACRVTVGEKIVVWDAFEDHWDLEMDYSSVGPFVFDKEQYIDELAKLKEPLPAMKGLKHSKIRTAVPYDVEHYYIYEADEPYFYEVWTDQTKNLSTIYYVKPSRFEQDDRETLKPLYMLPDEVMPAIYKHAKSRGYKLEEG